jgi:hypothetical protein
MNKFMLGTLQSGGCSWRSMVVVDAPLIVVMNPSWIPAGGKADEQPASGLQAMLHVVKKVGLLSFLRLSAA